MDINFVSGNVRFFSARQRLGESTGSCRAFILLGMPFTIRSAARKSCPSSEVGSSSDSMDAVSSQSPSSASDSSPVRAATRAEVSLSVNWETRACLTTDTARGFFLRSLRIGQSCTGSSCWYHCESDRSEYESHVVA